jgi:alpha-L-fucosidase 2
MNARGDGATGWSKAWKINIWARLHDGNRAYKLLKEQIHGNYYGNLFGFHPPFQIDGNFGYAAGVCEMLVQSHAQVSGEESNQLASIPHLIHLLPALPDAWSTGSIKGLKARGGFVVDMAWKDGKLTEAKIKSLKGRPLAVKYSDQLRELNTEAGDSYCLVLI